jgi:F0F1-type ATP synthase assembly protein I
MTAKKEPDKGLGKNENWGLVARILGVGFYIIGCIIGGVLGGLWLDRNFDTAPILLMAGLILGLVAAFWGVYQMLLPIIKDNKRERR